MQSMAKPTGSVEVTQLQLELAKNEHQLSELEVILADYNEERVQLVREISQLQIRLRDMEEQITSTFPYGDVQLPSGER
jgi:predicted  nucleic acid-binding Zn-ribbon protein